MWWYSREKGFDPCHRDSPSVWYTTELLQLYLRWAWLNYIFTPAVLATFTKAFLECSYQASLFTSLIYPGSCIFNISNVYMACITLIRNVKPGGYLEGSAFCFFLKCYFLWNSWDLLHCHWLFSGKSSSWFSRHQ